MPIYVRSEHPTDPSLFRECYAQTEDEDEAIELAERQNDRIKADLDGRMDSQFRGLPSYVIVEVRHVGSGPITAPAQLERRWRNRDWWMGRA